MSQLTDLSRTATQQLFILYSKAARQVRDKTLALAEKEREKEREKEKEQRRASGKKDHGPAAHGHASHGGNHPNHSNHIGHANGHRRGSSRDASSSQGLLSFSFNHAAPALSSFSSASSSCSSSGIPMSALPAGQAFLLSAGGSEVAHVGVGSASGLTAAQVAVAAAQQSLWLELDRVKCCLTSEELGVLALHLTQRKLEGLAKDLAHAHRDELNAGKTKLTTLLKDARFLLFPGALHARATGTLAADAPTATTTITNVAGEAGDAASTNVVPFTTAVAPAAAATAVSIAPPSSSLSESAITDLFVRCTVCTMQSRMGCNNFGELRWGDVMDKWRDFALFFFAFRADTNPNGRPQQTQAKTERQRQHEKGKCSIM